MKVLLSWLREFAPFEADPAELAGTLSDLGMAVEGMAALGAGLDGVVVAEVLATRPHPKADRIQLVDVDRGDGEALQICCGAFNMAAGDLVPLATLGTTMADGRLIERRKLRGEWSNGMLCSASELGLGSDGEGILVLPTGLRRGDPLAGALGLEGDVLYDLDLTGNRPDALSVAGLARDLAARLRLPFTLPDLAPAGSGAGAGVAGERAADRCRVELVAPDLCGRFVARVLTGVAIGPSPAWLANRLVAVGMRPINNVVDVSNYVMLELGQPSHTFDLGTVAGATLRVRWAREGEELVTLDGQTRTLGPRDGVIADGDDTAVGVAGVMGGRSTEISAATRDVLLEMAWWDPMSIARTSRRLGLRSEASTRFERGTDPLVIERAMVRFAELLARSCPVEVLAGQIDEPGHWPGQARVTVRPERVNALLGLELAPGQMADLLRPIGFEVTEAGSGKGQGGGAGGAGGPGGPPRLDVVVPPFRPDTTAEVDVIEEVARQYGYSRIPPSVPVSPRAGGLTPRQQDRRRLRRTLVGRGLVEAMPLPFLAPGDLRRTGLDDDAVTVTNPLVAEESVLRTSLLPGLLRTLAYNASHRSPGGQLFELGHVYLPGDRKAELPDEREHLGVALGGREASEAVRLWSVLADVLAVGEARLVAAELPGLHPTRAARVDVGGVAVGQVGEVDPAVAEAWEVPERVAWLGLDLQTLLDLPHGERPFRRFSRYPSSDLDLAFSVAEDVAAAEVAATVRRAAGELAIDVRLFDVFRGPAVGEGRRSLAYRLRLQAPDRTLTDADVAEVRGRVVEAAAAAHGAQLRG